MNIMGHYHPYKVDQVAREASAKCAKIDQKPTARELEDTYAAAPEAGLWRLIERAV